MKTVIGAMSGTSLDGVDVALINTDGQSHLDAGATHFRPYTKKERRKLQAAIAQCQSVYNEKVGGAPPPIDGDVKEAETLLHDTHVAAITELLEQSDTPSAHVDLVGFHGQTVLHVPEDGFTMQIGDGANLAQTLGIPVVHDFRSADIEKGGQGAPLVPIFHQAMASQAGVKLPVAFVNIGGVANVTIITEEGALTAFDTGPGNALIDDWIKSRTSKTYDQWGRIAGEGRVNEIFVNQLLEDPYFTQDAPKSLDRHAFSIDRLDHMSLADGAATLTAFSARTIATALEGQAVHMVYVCGGGVHNRTMMRMIKNASGCDVKSVEDIGFDPDFVEAYAFGYLAVRSVQKFPITFPMTTGVAVASTGGRLAEPH